MTLILAAMLGFVAGLRALTPLAAVSWAAAAGALSLVGTPLAWLGAAVTPWILIALALGELVNDKLPRTPSRKIPPAFAARVISGGLIGAALGVASGAMWIAAAVGALAAVGGTYGGASARAAMARAFGRDLPAALVEDAVALGLSVLGLVLLSQAVPIAGVRI